MKIKVCGITTIEQLNELDDLSIDLAGMIFYKRSPRCITDNIPAKYFRKNFSFKKAGVFVNAGYDEVMQKVNDYALDVVQLHGEEPPQLCHDLSQHIQVIKAFRLNDAYNKETDDLIRRYEDTCHYFLFDTASSKGLGGTGEKFNWNMIHDIAFAKPFFLSGGIGPDDAVHIQQFTHPHLYGVDINSRFEISPGIKDMSLVKQFVSSIKNNAK